MKYTTADFVKEAIDCQIIDGQRRIIMCIFGKQTQNMANIKTYIQQLHFDGSTYTRGSVVDILSTYKVVCQEFPFKILPEAKELASRDWNDEDGLDVYYPTTRRMKEYETDVDFLYVGTENAIREDLKNFINFLYGRDNGAVGVSLAVYNEYTGIGRKDVVVTKVSDDVYYGDDNDTDAIAKFSVTFKVNDPVTDVTPVYTTTEGVRSLTALNF